MSRIKHLPILISLCLLFVLVASACSGTPAAAPTATSVATPTAVSTAGVIQGVVYNDLNGNGQIDPGEKPLENVSVSVSGCGSDQTVVTGADGVFEFSGLTSPSSCTILAIRPGWTFSGSYPSLGYPLVVPLGAGRGAVISLYLAPAQPTVAVAASPATTETPLVTASPLFTSTPAVVSPSQSAPTVTAININIYCYAGPGTDYDNLGVLVKDLPVPIEASNPDGSWWEIDNPWHPGLPCWVSGALTSTSGDTTQVQKVNATGQVTKVRLSGTPNVIKIACSSSFDETLTGTITTNGPALVFYQWELESPGGDNFHSLGSQSVYIPSNTTVTVTQDFSRSCGTFVGLLAVTSPNSKTGQFTWEIQAP